MLTDLFLGFLPHLLLLLGVSILTHVGLRASVLAYPEEPQC